LAAAQATGALGTAAFVKLSENEEATGDTGEQRMLQASRKEIAKKVDADDRGLSRLRHKVAFFLDLYVWEPLCTGFRFLHLALIFVPVILAVPAIWIGRRQKDRDNERSGTLWWYGFLVTGMEWAGPAFIKVRTKLMSNFRARFQGQTRKQGVLSCLWQLTAQRNCPEK
jgi:aarF domain-containing kinase